MSDIDSLYNDLTSIISEDRISRDETILASYAMDLTSFPREAPFPPLVVLPETAEEVKEILVAANKYKVPVVPMSRGSNIGGLALPNKEEMVVDLRLMNKIEINTDAAYAIVEPGVTHHQLSLEAKKHGFINHLPTATGGGSSVANSLMRPSGNLSAKWDPDPILALEVVTPTGEIIRTGSASFENGGWRSRYGPFPDLTGVFTCSYGSMGIITKMSVKLIERGEEERLLVTKFDTLPPALDYMKLLVRRNLADSVTFWTWNWNLLHELMVCKTKGMPEAMLKEDQITPPEGTPFGIASARLNGYKEVVDVQEKTCIRLAKELGGDFMSHDELKQMYPGSYTYLNSYFVEGIHHKPGEESAMRELHWVSGYLANAEPSKIIELEKELWGIARKEAKPPYFFRVLPYNHAREFFFAFVILVNTSLQEDKEYILHLQETYAKLYYTLLEKYGAIMFRFRQDPDFLSLTGPYEKLLRSIKNYVDPNNIMHPGSNLF